MAKLRLHHELYPTSAVQSAVEAFRNVCTTNLTNDPPYHMVEVTAPEPEHEAAVASELGNYALAISVEEHRK